MSGKGKQPRAGRKREIPLGYLEASPEGNRSARRMFAKEQRARAKGRATGHSHGVAPVNPVRKDGDDVQ
jgi:hypothetical protein